MYGLGLSTFIYYPLEKVIATLKSNVELRDNKLQGVNNLVAPEIRSPSAFEKKISKSFPRTKLVITISSARRSCSSTLRPRRESQSCRALVHSSISPSVQTDRAKRRVAAYIYMGERGEEMRRRAQRERERIAGGMDRRACNRIYRLELSRVHQVQL